MGIGGIGGPQFEPTLQDQIDTQAASAAAKDDMKEDLQALLTSGKMAEMAGKRASKSKLLKKNTKRLQKTPEAKKAQETQKKKETAAKNFQNKNPALKEEKLLRFYERSQSFTSKEEFREEVEKQFPNPALADEALDFLKEVTEDTAQLKLIDAAQQKLQEEKKLEIADARRFASELVSKAQTFSGDPKVLHEFAYQLMHNPKASQVGYCFEVYRGLNSTFSRPQINDVIKHCLHYGGELVKNNKTENVLLAITNRNIRAFQSIIQVFRASEAKTDVVDLYCKSNGLDMPKYSADMK